MKLEFETIYCDIDEKFIPFEGDLKCLSCLNKNASKISENYLEVDICYDNGGGCDVTKLYFCDLCYEKHVRKVEKKQIEALDNIQTKNKFLYEKQIIYRFSY